MNCINNIRAFLLLGPLLFLFLLSSRSFAQYDLEVDSNMLLWKAGLEYRTDVRAMLAFSDVTLKFEHKDKESGKVRHGEGTQNLAFLYSGAMAHSTRALNPSPTNGEAWRHYENTDVRLIKANISPMEITVESGFWETLFSNLGQFFGGSGLPDNWAEDFEKVSGAPIDGYVILRQRADSPRFGQLLSKPLEFVNEEVRSLNNQDYRLKWDRLAAIRNAKIRVSKASVQDGQLVPLEAQPSSIKFVEDVISRESKLLYEALSGHQGSHKDGDTWIIDGRDLQGLIHPQLDGFLTGEAIVIAKNVYHSSELGNFRGLSLSLVPNGYINGRYQQASLVMNFKTVKFDQSIVSLPMVENIVGEILLDSDNQVVRFASLELSKGDYEGPLPKMGELNKDINGDVRGDLHFKLTYSQMINEG